VEAMIFRLSLDAHDRRGASSVTGQHCKGLVFVFLLIKNIKGGDS